ncbi:MAG: cytochrome P450 [Tepidiformaceae bacterium]
MGSNTSINLDDPASLADPAGYFGLARERGEVQWSDVHRGWMVISHAAVEAGLRDNEVLSSDRKGAFSRAATGRSAAFQRVTELLSGWMNFRDPPAQTRLREPVRAAFSPRAVNAFEPEIRSIVEGVAAELDLESADLNHGFARPIPALVIGAILGVPAEDRHRFYDWSHDLGQFVFSINPSGAPEESVSRATGEFIDFFSAVIARERREPSGTLLSAIVANAGEELTPLELVGACTLLLFGGHETTTTLLVNAIGILLERPDLLAWLRPHPEADVAAVEEFMRVQGPARAIPRKIMADHERGGQQLHAGQNIFLCVAAANHDAAVFASPAEIDLRRDPNPHLGFGWGVHYCLGSTLARLESRIALRTLMDRFPEMAPIGPVAAPRASALGYGRRPLRARLK